MEHFHLYGLVFMMLGAKSEPNGESIFHLLSCFLHYLSSSNCFCDCDLAVVVSIEEEAVLPCVAPEPYLAESCHRVRWIKNVSGAEQEILFKPARVGNPERVKNPDVARVKWKSDGNESHSLFLTKVIKSDEGMYSCEIWRGWDRISVQNTSLTIKG